VRQPVHRLPAPAVLVTAALLTALGACGGQPPPPPRDGALPPRVAESKGERFYVATTGSDAAPGTAEAPWRTVQKALDTLQAGQIAFVRAGTYRENLVMHRAGTARAPITIRNQPGERPVLQPAERAPTYPLRLTSGAAHFRIQGFVIERARGASTMNVVGLGEPRGAHDYEISDCEIRFARNSSGVFVDDTNYNVWLLGNTVHGNNEPGVQHQGIYFEGRRSVIANNVVYDQRNGFGIQVRAGARDVIVASNTVSGVSLSGILVESTARGVTVVNNISAFNGGYAVRGLQEGPGRTTGNRAFNNLGFGNRSGEFANSRAAVVSFEKADNVVEDPRFVDRARADFRLAPGSPAIDRAQARWSPDIDRALRPRPADLPPDLGAYERSE
jgi:hypothetical protein